MAASASSNLKTIHARIAKILENEKTLTPQECEELTVLGRLAQQMDDVKYRRYHTSPAMSKAHEKKGDTKPPKKKSKK